MTDTVVVGLIADPGLPERVASRIRAGLGDHLARVIDRATEWRIEVSSETLPLTESGSIPLLDHAPRLLERHGWDIVVYLTDLPRRRDGEPLVAEFSSEARAVLVSLPALGAWRVTARTRDVLVRMLASLVGISGKDSADAYSHHGTTDHTTSTGIRYLVEHGLLNRFRLLAGMVRNNRPGTLLPALSSTAAAGIGTGAFGIFYASIWAMANALPPLRLTLISVAAIAALSIWLIFYNGLWTTQPAGNGRGRPWLDNVSTIITVGLSVALMYLILYVLLLIAALTVITDEYLASQLDRSVSVADYLRLAWLAASLGTMGGAIGSNFDSDRAIQQATYGRREYERRQLAEDAEDATPGDAA